MNRYQPLVAQALHSWTAALCVSLFVIVPGCTPVPTFPDTKTVIIKTPQDFATVQDEPSQYQSRPLQLAGRIIRAETTPKGVTAHAEWLPFPENTFAGPEALSTGQLRRRFSMQFSGDVDHDGQRQGNEFIMVGRVAGTQDMVTAQGRNLAIPNFVVQCLHIWKTAGTDLVEFIWMDPLDESYPPPLEETYCVSSHF